MQHTQPLGWVQDQGFQAWRGQVFAQSLPAGCCSMGTGLVQRAARLCLPREQWRHRRCWSHLQAPQACLNHSTQERFGDPSLGAGCKAGPRWDVTVGCSSASSQLCWDTLPWSQLGSVLAPSPGSCLLTPSLQNSPSSALTSSAEAREAACAPPLSLPSCSAPCRSHIFIAHKAAQEGSNHPRDSPV